VTAQEIIKLLSVVRFDVHDEKHTQEQIEKVFSDNKISFHREYKLDAKNIPDFFIDGIAIELKIKGEKKKIYRQCDRYCQFDQVKELILVTNRSMGFPQEINGNPCYVLNIGRAWL
jgi:hypothetical protein